MKRIINVFFSSWFTIVLLIAITVAMGAATFIEDRYDTITARILVYNARWFELLFLLLIINFIGHIQKYNMLRKEKLAGLLFHLAFIAMIIGAAITRYFGTDGSMHIREGESSNIIYSTEPYLIISTADNNKIFNYEIPLKFGQITDNSFHLNLISSEKNQIAIECNNYIKNAREKIEENVRNGIDMIELKVYTQNGREQIFMEKGEVKNLGKIAIAFDNKERNDAIQISDKEGILNINSPYDLTQTEMMKEKMDTILKDTTVEFKRNYIYDSGSAKFLFANFYKSAKKQLVSGNPDNNVADALIIDVTVNDKKHTINVFGGQGYIANPQKFYFNGSTISFAYGIKQIKLPFSLYLNDFILERYPGSMSPSSYASEVTLIDNRNNLKENHRIFMNNVLDYDKYRFFQSSYDTDEKGTVLSVNHDFYGTWVTYIGYFLLTIGFLLSLFNKNSRFHSLRRNIAEIRIKRKANLLIIALILVCGSSAFSQSSLQKQPDPEYAAKFGHLLVQTFDGRFEPVNSLAYDIMHKISRKDNFNIAGKGKMDAMQVLLDMMIDPEFWKAQKIIYVKAQSVRDIIGVTGQYASFSDFFDKDSKYKLQTYGEESFRKKRPEQNGFDKEIIKVDERINIFMMVLRGTVLKIFPEQGSMENKWVNWDENAALIPLSGAIKIINDDLQLKPFTYAGILQAYLMEILAGNYSRADKILGYISSIQRSGTNDELLPSETKVNVEIFYNEAQIFTFLKNSYALLSVLLLLLAFIDNLKSKKNKIISLLLNFCIILLGAAFLYHTFGMALRWYITDHAPWSNGYEALILVAWGSLLAGFSFVRYSKITLAATPLLAFFVLMTAGHSSYDPQLTNLQPVLKSYWLIIHVATMTISYGFLGLGCILGIMNMVIMLFKTAQSRSRLELIIKELTCINEMNLIIGIILATLGTFLGAVWANESWGRYWGWDAKETWALIIVITYALILHLRLIPKLKGIYLFNVASVIGFGSVIMTFIGVNYYLSKGMHSYGGGDTPVFPLWAWGIILSLVTLIVVSGIKEKQNTVYNK